MNLSKPQLKAFKAVLETPGIRLREFMNQTKLSKSRAYSILQQLEAKGLVSSDGKPAIYTLSKREETAHLSHMFRLYSPYPLETVLSEMHYALLKEILHENKTAEELMKAVGLSRSQTYKTLSRFAGMGLVRNSNDRFYISEDHPLYKCLLEYENQPKLNTEVEKNGAILWQGDGEYLVQVDDHKKYVSETNKPWRFTSMSAVNRYGINVIPPKIILYVADKITPVIENSDGDYTSLEDTLLFTLLNNTGESKTYARYMILLHKDEIDVKHLKQKARQYKLDKILESILYDLKPLIRW